MTPKKKNIMKHKNISSLPSQELIVVNASAGSGKTYALAKRYLKLLMRSPSREVPLALRSVLAITFTNKATIEMKERIMDFLKRIAFDNFPEKEQEKDIYASLGMSRKKASSRAWHIVDELIRHYSFFQVQTIDSFINAILLGCALHIDRSASFTIQRDYGRHISWCLDSVIDQAQDEERVREFLKDFLRHYLFVENHTGWFPREDIRELMVSLFTLSNRYGSTFRVHGGESRDVIRKKNVIYDHVRKLASAFPDGMSKTSRNTIERFIDKNDKTFTIRELPGAFQKPSVPMNKYSTCPPGFVKSWEKIRREIRELVELDAVTVYDPYIKFFQHLLIFFKSLSKKEDVIFLEELNRTARSLFGEEGVTVAELYYRLAARYRHYLIDEFQDTSVLQWQNLKMMIEEGLSNGGSLFYVGDKKQAIYRFRGGESRLFDRVTREFKQFNIARTRLVKNWRSQKAIVEFNNTVFSRSNLSRALSDSGIEREVDSVEDILDVFKDAEQMFCEDKSYGYVQVERIDEENREERDDIMKKKILDLVAGLKKRFSYEEMALLTRDNNEVELVTSWLLEAGIPVESEKTMDVLKNPLVKELLAFLKFLHVPVDDIHFAAFITGEIFSRVAGFTQEKMREFLFELHAGKKYEEKKGLYSIFRQKYPAVWDAYIEEFFKSVGFISPYEMLVSIYRRFDLVEKFKESQAFFMKLLELVKQKEDEYVGLGEFLTYCDDAPAEDLYVHVTRSDSVKVLTVHKAKGLEFPVVIIPFLRIDIIPETGGKGTSSYVVGDDTGSTSLVRITGAYRVYSEKLGALYAEAYKKACIDELNAIYVALTRPQHELYVFIPRKSSSGNNKARCIIPGNMTEIGSKKKYEKTKKERDQVLMDIPASSYRDWVGLLKDEFAGEDALENRKNIEYGNIMHALLSRIGNCKDKDINELVLPAVEYARSTFPYISDFSSHEQKCRALLENTGLNHIFYIPDGCVFCEYEVVNRFGDTKRLDRLIVKHEEVWVIDYKSTRENEEAYQEQVKEYIQIMKDVYPGHRISGLLVYLDEMKIDEVKI